MSADPTDRDRLEQIHRVLASYPLLVDAGDVDGCLRLFTEDCEFVVAGDGVSGVDALRTFLRAAVDSGPRGLHLAGTPLVDIASDGRTATSLQSFIFVANGTDSIARGTYRDLLDLEGDQPRLRRRDVALLPGAA